MDKLRSGDFSGVETPLSAFVNLRNETITENPRTSVKYKQECLEAIGLGEVPDLERYGHLKPQDFPFLRVVVRRGNSCMWLPDSARTSVRGFRHRLITDGPPVRVPLHHLSKMDTECLEAAVKEDVARGQLVKGD